MRVGVLTGGGDCPGLNAVIRAVVRRGVKEFGYEFVGFRDGWKGPLEGVTTELGIPQVRGILPRGGTILGSSRTNPFKIDGGVERIKENLAELGVDALVAIGGEDTLGVATKLSDLGVTSSACRRRSTTTSTPPTSPSASTPRSTSRWRRSTGCTPRPSRTTGCSWSR
jgi:6-phosphofructokinase 1